MKSYIDESLRFPELRAHPWTISEHDLRGKYVDFKVHPHLIEATLEDFSEFSSQLGVQNFYDLVRALNVTNGSLETNDCGLRPPKTHSDSNSDKSLVVMARLCLFYRQNAYNILESATEWLQQAFRSGLQKVDPQFSAKEAVVGLTLQPTAFIDLPNETEALLGQELMLTFWAYGNDADEAFTNFGRAIRNVLLVSNATSDHIQTLFDHDSIKRDVTEIRGNVIVERRCQDTD